MTRFAWYDVRYAICPSCEKVSPQWFYLKDIQEWCNDHKSSCGVSDFKVESYLEGN